MKEAMRLAIGEMVGLMWYKVTAFDRESYLSPKAKERAASYYSTYQRAHRMMSDLRKDAPIEEVQEVLEQVTDMA